MKLYLASYRIPDLQTLVELVGKQPGNIKVALIPNAKDYYAPRARAVKIRLVLQALRQAGLHATVVDLHEYRRAPVKLATRLKQFDLLWVMGGNTFCLREAMQQSGFDKIVRDVLDSGVVYAGESAGACVAGTDLRGIEYADDPEYAEKVIWKGLRLTEHYIVPHADSPDFGPLSARIIAERGADPTMVVLNDNQAWVVNGNDAWKVTGIKPDEMVDA